MPDFSALKSISPGTVWSSIKNGWKTALFMEAMRNLAWSRGYLWYVELDGVPNPFQRGGVLGLPCKSINFTLGQGNNYEWSAGVNTLKVPQSIGSVGSMNLNLVDDEQGTLRQFFERWYNMVYNPYYGVLPVTEACKQISIYFQKYSRRNVKRVYYDIDTSIDNLFGNGFNLGGIVKKFNKDFGENKSTDSMDFLVYPTGTVQYNLQTDANALIEFSVSLEIAYFINQDFGNPNVNSGVKTILDTQFGGISEGNSWLDKIADYI
jgi:hypothetical protein